MHSVMPSHTPELSHLHSALPHPSMRDTRDRATYVHNGLLPARSHKDVVASSRHWICCQHRPVLFQPSRPAAGTLANQLHQQPPPLRLISSVVLKSYRFMSIAPTWPARCSYCCVRLQRCSTLHTQSQPQECGGILALHW